MVKRRTAREWVEPAGSAHRWPTRWRRWRRWRRFSDSRRVDHGNSNGVFTAEALNGRRSRQTAIAQRLQPRILLGRRHDQIADLRETACAGLAVIVAIGGGSNFILADFIQAALPSGIVAIGQSHQRFSCMGCGDFFGISAQLVLSRRIGMDANQVDRVTDQCEFAGGVDDDQPVAGWRNQAGLDFGQRLPQPFLNRGRFDSVGGRAGEPDGGLGRSHQIDLDRGLVLMIFDGVRYKAARQNAQCLFPFLRVVGGQINQRQSDRIILFQTFSDFSPGLGR